MSISKPKVSVDVVKRSSGKYQVEAGPFTTEQVKELDKAGVLKDFEVVDARLAPPQSAFDRLIKGKTFTFKADGYGGMIVPDVYVEAFFIDRGTTPVDKNFKQTSDMLMYEACAGTVVKTGTKSYTARLSEDGDRSITINDTNVKIGDRVLNIENEDGSSQVVAIPKTEAGAAKLKGYNDGDSVFVYVTTTNGKVELDILPTVEKHVPYPRQATVNGVSYPYIYGPDDEGKIPSVIVKTAKGWTIGGNLVRAQHAENVAVLKADSGGVAPKRLSKKARTVLFVVKNLPEVVQAIRTAKDSYSVMVDEQFITVNQDNLRKQLKRSNVFGGAVFTKNHDPKLTHGWHKQPANEEERQIFNGVFRGLYSEALKKLNLAPALLPESRTAEFCGMACRNRRQQYPD